MKSAALLTESDLAAAAERSREYIRRARALGLIAPIGATGAGIQIYSRDAISDVRGITRAVFGMSEASAKMWEHYKNTREITKPENVNWYGGPKKDLARAT